MEYTIVAIMQAIGTYEKIVESESIAKQTKIAVKKAILCLGTFGHKRRWSLTAELRFASTGDVDRSTSQ
jgi:hypothetical protein